MTVYAAIVLPLLADGAALLLLFWLVAPLSARLAAPSGLNSLLLVGVYLFFLLGVFLLRKLEPVAENRFPWELGPKTRGVLALLFGLVMMTAVSYQLGYFDVFLQAGPTELDEGASSSLFVYGPSAWLFLSMFYIFVLAFPIAPRISPQSKVYSLAALLGLATIHSLLLLAVAQLKALTSLLPWQNLLWLLLSVLLLALLFAPPRLLYAQKHAGWPGLLSFITLLLAAGWLVVR